MECFKKYINALFIITLVFHSGMMGTEHVYVPFSGSHVVESTNAISEFYSEHPTMVVVVSAAALLGSAVLFLAKDKIVELAKKNSEHLEQKIEKECNEQLKKFEESSKINRYILSVLKPCTGTFKNYVENNIPYMLLAAISVSLGYIIGHPYGGTSIGTASLIWGLSNQGFREMHHRFDSVDQRIETMINENKVLHEKTQKEVSDINGKVDHVLTDLEDTKVAIQTQMSKVEECITQSIQVVGGKVVELSTKLDQVPQQIIDLVQELETAKNSLKNIKGTNKEIVAQNKAITFQVAVLSQKLSAIFDNYTATTQSLDTWQENLINQMTTLTNTTQKQMQEVSGQVGTQNEKLHDLKMSMDSQFQQCFNTAQQQNQLLQSFEKIQESHGKQFMKLLSKINESEQRDQCTLDFVRKIASDEEGRATKNAEMVTKLNEINLTNKTTVDTLCSRMQALEDRINCKISQLDTKVENGFNVLRQESTSSMNSIYDRIEPLEQKTEITNEEIRQLKGLLADQSSKINELFSYNFKLQEEIKGLRKTNNEILHNTEDIKETLGKPSRSFFIEENPSFSVPFDSIESGEDRLAYLLSSKRVVPMPRQITYS